MKKRILFVDDDPLVLQGMERAFRRMRAEWDMVFAESAEQALALMAEEPFDVVVSDMHMPAMNGPALLTEVMQRYPKTVRLILSGTADQELIMKCVGSAHQFLAKPCDLQSLKATVERTLKLASSLQNEAIRRLVSQMNRLPTMPSLYVKLVDLLQTPDFSLEQVGDLVAQDLAMTAKLLQLVNSAFFGLARRISNPAEAVAYLGVDMVKTLVLSLDTFDQFATVSCSGLSMEQLWHHCLETAGAAKVIARAEESATKLVDEAFLGGLLHDVGKLVFAANFGGQYRQVVRLAETGEITLAEAERQSFQATHADVGGYLLGLWGLPVPVVEAIALHHSPEQSTTPAFSPLSAVHVANALVQELRPSGLQALPAINLSYLELLGLSGRLEGWRRALREASQPDA